KQIIRDIDSPPSFSPDGRQFAFGRGIISPPANDILVANADGSDEHVVAHRPGFSPGWATVSWSADGQHLAVVTPETRDGLARYVLAVISLKNNALRDLHAFPVTMRTAAWLPDGHGVLVVGIDPDSSRSQIWFVSYPKGEVSHFTNDLTDYNV